MNWDFVKDPPDQSHSEEDFYALANGYIKPEAVLNDPEQIDAVNEALFVLQSFFDALRDADIIEEM